MMEEEGMVIVGLLVGLNVLDANLCLKGEDLDSQVKWRFGLQVKCFLRPEDLQTVLNLRRGQRASVRGLCKAAWSRGVWGEEIMGRGTEVHRSTAHLGTENVPLQLGHRMFHE